MESIQARFTPGIGLFYLIYVELSDRTDDFIRDFLEANYGESPRGARDQMLLHIQNFRARSEKPAA